MKLIKMTKNKYVAVSSDFYSVGTLKEVGLNLVNEHGFDPLEVEAAFKEMNKCNNDIAEFGINNSFICSWNSSETSTELNKVA